MLRPKLKLERLANCTHATIESLAANFEGCPLVDASAIAKSAPLTDAPPLLISSGMPLVNSHTRPLFFQSVTPNLR